MPAEQLRKVDDFLTELDDNVRVSTVREINFVPARVLIDERSELYFAFGTLTFQNESDAIRTYNDLVIMSTVERGFIEYSRILLTDDTDHYPNPLPSVITHDSTQGNKRNLDNYDLRTK